MIEVSTLKSQLLVLINKEIQLRNEKAAKAAGGAGGAGGAGETKKVVKQTKTVLLPKPQKGGILHSATEVDEYINNIRQTLMTYIDNNEDIMIN